LTGKVQPAEAKHVVTSEKPPAARQTNLDRESLSQRLHEIVAVLEDTMCNDDSKTARR